MTSTSSSSRLRRANLELMALNRAAHAGKTTTTVQELLGRKDRTLDEWLQDHLAAFR